MRCRFRDLIGVHHKGYKRRAFSFNENSKLVIHRVGGRVIGLHRHLNFASQHRCLNECKPWQ